MSSGARLQEALAIFALYPARRAAAAPLWSITNCSQKSRRLPESGAVPLFFAIASPGADGQESPGRPRLA